MSSSRPARHSDSRAATASFEPLESRRLLSHVMSPTFERFHPQGLNQPAASAGPSGVSPATMRQAYGIDTVMFGSVAGDGAGQTIAIIDAYNQPNVASDLAAFDAQYGLAAPPGFKVLNESGQSTLPSNAAIGSWGVEISLDVEWAHVVAPKANILLLEANSAFTSDLWTAINTARNYAGVSVVCMSWGGDEAAFDTFYDSSFATPAGHTGVTFVSSSGDNGAYSSTGSGAKIVQYPAVSPDVLSVGGTTLATSGGNYSSESAWSGSGGGISQYYAQPAFQKGVVSQSSAYRTVPDVSLDADPGSGVPVYDSYDNGISMPWEQLGGTSLAAPMWAGVIAIADEGRVNAGLQTLDGATGTLPAIYSISAGNFHDITTGSNGYSAGPGYDLVTGRGSPIVNVLANALVGSPVIGSFTASPTSVTTGAPVILTASNITDPAAGIAGVSFFRESNGSAGLQIGSDTFVGPGTQSGSTWTLTASTAGLSPGVYTYYAVATDSSSVSSNAVSTNVTVIAPSLPYWVTGSNATWTATTDTLEVTGPGVSINEDPSADTQSIGGFPVSEPIVIVDSGQTLQIRPTATPSSMMIPLYTAPTSGQVVHLGGLVVHGTVLVDSLGAARTHNNHIVLAIGTATGPAPTFSVTPITTSKLDLEDNDMIVHNGSLSAIQALAAQGRAAKTGILDGTWTGTGLTSSVAASVDGTIGFESTVLAVVLNSDQILGQDASWTVGAAAEPLNGSDVIVKYTYNGDAALEGYVAGDAVTILSGDYNSSTTVVQNDWAFGAFTGSGMVNDDDITIINGLYGAGTAGGPNAFGGALANVEL